MIFAKTKPPGFRKWITLENLKSKLIEGADSTDFPDKMFAYLSASFEIKPEKLEKKTWRECFELFGSANDRFSVKINIPIIRDAPKDGEETDWEYEGRTWYYYSHLLATAYGWDLEYIANLGVEEAFAHIQEILTDSHLEKEFMYSLSEIAYPYNKSTKKGEFKPMRRPYWMKPLAPREVKKIKMRKDFIPMGKIIDISGLPEEFQIEGLVTEKK